MITYRSNVHNLAMAVSAKSAAFSLVLSECLSYRHTSQYQEKLVEELPSLQRQAAEIRIAYEKLIAVLPGEVSSKVQQGDQGLVRHLNFIDLWLGKSQPEWCKSDPVNIITTDIPLVLEWFEEWYDHGSSEDDNLNSRLAPLISNGQVNSALREAWAIFKTRMVKRFNLSRDLDGHRLADALFGSSSVTNAILTEKERKGYLDLFKGLYSLFRNDVTHNDLPSNPEEIDAVLGLINSTLMRFELVGSETTPER